MRRFNLARDARFSARPPSPALTLLLSTSDLVAVFSAQAQAHGGQARSSSDAGSESWVVIARVWAYRPLGGVDSCGRELKHGAPPLVHPRFLQTYFCQSLDSEPELRTDTI